MENDALPYAIREYKNLTGSVSWRVDGYLQGKRMRKNFADQSQAMVYCDTKNLEAANASENISLLQTRLSSAQLAEAEAAFAHVDGRWSLSAVISAGTVALTNQIASLEAAPLLVQWLKLITTEVTPLRYDEIRYCCERFLKAHPGLKTDQFVRAKVRAWVDDMDRAPATKRNNRSALHRWGSWLVERGYVKENPAAGIRIAKGPALHRMPSVLTAAQARAFMQAMQTAECRRLKGWATLCLFCGLRPSEALRLTWGEISLKTAELTVQGLKRGSKPRIVKLTPAAGVWLKSVKADGEAAPGYFARPLWLGAIATANRGLSVDEQIVWDEDILRHSYASYSAGNGVPMHELAEQMGNSPATIYAHYRNPRPAAQVKAFWAIRPLSQG